MAKRDKGQSGTPAWEWKPFSAQTYEETLAQGVHFSLKAINSNARTAGVRVGAASGRALPYVSLVRAVADGHRFPLDYARNQGSTSKVFKQIANVARWGDEAPHPKATPTEVSAIHRALEAAHGSDRVVEEREAPISLRARQVLFPDGAGGYAALVPLAAPVFAGHIRQRWFARSEATGARPPTRAYMGFGGANPQNTGRLIWHMQAPLFFSGPEEDSALRRVYALFYRGVSMRLPRERMEDWRRWRTQGAEGGAIPSNLRVRQQEERRARDIARILLHRGHRAGALVAKHQADLPTTADTDASPARTAPDVDPVVRGLMEPEARARDWTRRFAERLAEDIGRYRFADGATLGLDSTVLGSIAGWIEEEVRYHGAP